MMESVLIRSARAVDLNNLAVLGQQVWISTYATEGVRHDFSTYVRAEFTPERFRATLDNPQRIVIVATLDEHLVGYAEIGLDRPCPVGNIAVPEIMTLYVLERFGGQGIGYRLLNEAERRVKDLGHRQVWLDAFEENHRALQFYDRQGYRRIGVAYFEELRQRYRNIVFLKDLA